MADPWSEFHDAPTPQGARPADKWAEFNDAPVRPTPAPAPNLHPTGLAHDGDTFRLNDGRNARLFGVDAFELNQNGFSPNGATVPLGQQARSALLPYATPNASVSLTGDVTYGRPVASLNNGGDAGAQLLHDGLAITIPNYLRSDPQRFVDYTQTERLARLNRRGAFGLTYQTPASFRHGEPLTRDTNDAIFWDEPTPFAGLPKPIEQGYISIWMDPKSKPEDLIAYANTNGFKVDPDQVRERYRQRAITKRPDPAMNYVRPPRVLTNLGDGAFGAGLRGFADPFNLLDEAGAVADTLVPGRERENLWNSSRRFGDIYGNNLEQNRAILDYDEENHPWARFGGQLAGGLVVPGMSIEGVGAAAARKALEAGATRFAAEQAARNAVVSRLGLAGAIEGGVAGAGQGEDLQSRATGLAIGIPVGTALGIGTGIAAPKVAQIFGVPFSRLVGRDGERAAEGFTDGALDTARASTENKYAGPQRPTPVMEPRAPGGDSSPSPSPWDEFADAPMPMRADLDPPAMFGPEMAGARIPDRIDVNGRPRPLLDPATHSERMAAAQRLEPRDIMPLPSNAVDGLPEADRITAGRYEHVRAPKERDTLDPRSVANANTGAPIAARGPLDLVSWLRSQGGIRAEGGELEHAGIGNAPRAGIDFAGGENRYGPLISNSGMSYDDAAFRAWEAGYFPSHAERPTPTEFLQALTDTHSGRNRAFHPDDLPEVDAFNAARQQRWDVEAAREAGAPLSIDRGAPADLADLDRNAAPIEAYQEWGENAPNLAGNIRLDKLDSPQAIKRALSQVDRISGGFDAARRGRITQAETERLAAELNMSPGDLLKRRGGQAFNAEEALASRQILAKSGNELVNMAKTLQRGDASETDMVRFREAIVRHAAIQEQVSGAAAEAGRALQQYRMVASSRAVRGDVLRHLIDEGGGIDGLRDAAEMIVDQAENPAKLNRIVKQMATPTWKDKAQEVWYNTILSGPKTHAANILSNLYTTVSQIPEYGVASAIGRTRTAFSGSAERITATEVGARAIGLVAGVREAVPEMARTMRTGLTRDMRNGVEAPRHAIGGRLGTVIRTPTRALEAEDEFFKALARKQELYGQAVRQADAEGLKGKAAVERATALAQNPTDDMLRKARDYALYLTFQEPLRQKTLPSNISKLTNDSPALKALIPFVRTPWNILRYAVERTPLAPASSRWRADFAAGGIRRDLAVAKVSIGTGIGAWALTQALDGKVTGAGPSDRRQRDMLIAQGWQPYSLKIGNRYYSYARLDPFATIFGGAADMAQAAKDGQTGGLPDQAAKVALSAAHNLGNKTFLPSIGALMDAFDNPDRAGEAFIGRMLGSAVPSVVAQGTQITDPYQRDAESLSERMTARVPGLSDSLPARVDVLGRPMVRDGAFGPDWLSPVATRDARPDPTLAALSDAGITIGRPARSIRMPGDSKNTKLPRAEYNHYQTAVGQLAKPELDTLVRANDWIRMSQEDQKGAVDDILRGARKDARDMLFPKGLPTARQSIKMPGGMFGNRMNKPKADWSEFRDAR
ncbi:hypothetical protein NED98_05725 [Sphingomonas sp. MMSM20]|uniref:thermonuclease family protein n=1 Tax=Sphingomonas lycopersici TaxID=2951807 RepID=UPI0022388BB1|nr:hypothetical protein [Sphingomonas lycopersici]MCW6529739.1 hypothetical protein [Sphingomonas lycopersici]